MRAGTRREGAKDQAGGLPRLGVWQRRASKALCMLPEKQESVLQAPKGSISWREETTTSHAGDRSGVRPER